MDNAWKVNDCCWFIPRGERKVAYGEVKALHPGDSITPSASVLVHQGPDGYNGTYRTVSLLAMSDTKSGAKEQRALADKVIDPKFVEIAKLQRVKRQKELAELAAITKELSEREEGEGNGND